MILRLFLLFTLVPITELWLLLRLGRTLGPLPTLALVLGTGALGAWLAHREGVRAWSAVHRELEAGRLPGRQLIDALLIFVAGVVLLTPGLLTDVAGFFLLIPTGRTWVREWCVYRWSKRASSWRTTITTRGPSVDVSPRRERSGAADGDRVIEVRPEDVIVESEEGDRQG